MAARSHGFRVVRLGRVASTQDQLRERARAGEDVAGLCLRATAQTRGRGRRGAPWASAPGGSYQSAGLGREAFPWLTLALGVGVAEALDEGLDGLAVHGAGVAVKWPNDLYLGGGKLGGIIVEVVAGQVVAGVGVNVANAPPPAGAALSGADPETVSELVLVGLRRGVALAGAGGEAVRERFAARDVLRGRDVAVATGDEPTAVLTGVALGVDEVGALLVAAGGGVPVRVTTGHVVRFGGRLAG